MFFDTRSSSIKESVVTRNSVWHAAATAAFMHLIKKTKNELCFKVGYNF